MTGLHRYSVPRPNASSPDTGASEFWWQKHSLPPALMVYWYLAWCMALNYQVTCFFESWELTCLGFNMQFGNSPTFCCKSCKICAKNKWASDSDPCSVLISHVADECRQWPFHFSLFYYSVLLASHHCRTWTRNVLTIQALGCVGKSALYRACWSARGWRKRRFKPITNFWHYFFSSPCVLPHRIRNIIVPYWLLFF